MDGNDSYLSGWYILACIYMTVVIIISVLFVRITSKPDMPDVEVCRLTVRSSRFARSVIIRLQIYA